jgi:uncharacterized membrane protein YwzB
MELKKEVRNGQDFFIFDADRFISILVTAPKFIEFAKEYFSNDTDKDLQVAVLELLNKLAIEYPELATKQDIETIENQIKYFNEQNIKELLKVKNFIKKAMETEQKMDKLRIITIIALAFGVASFVLSLIA